MIRQLLEQHRFDYLVFSSVNGVQFFFDRVQLFDKQLTFLQSVRIAVTGSGTDNMLRKYIGRGADIIPEQQFSAEGVAEKLAEEAQRGKHFLHLRASRGRDTLRRQLEKNGGLVTEIAVYQSLDVEQPLQEIAELMRRGEIHYVTVTSSAIAGSLVRMFGNELKRTELVSMSPITSQTLRELGFPPQHEAETASMNGILDIFKQQNPNK
jgi:uroporphyrinogen III methyltransferase/synthase